MSGINIEVNPDYIRKLVLEELDKIPVEIAADDGGGLAYAVDGIPHVMHMEASGRLENGVLKLKITLSGEPAY